MANGFQEGSQGGISFSSPIFSFGNTNPSINGGYSFDLPMAAIQSFSNQALSFTSNNSSQNRGFLSNVLNTTQQNVNATANRAFGYQEGALRTISGISSGVQGTVQTAVENRTRGCFITTAICQHENKPDNCAELTILRKFRDEVMLENEELAPYVSEYYAIAPSIVEQINARPDAKECYAALRSIYLQPAISAIVRGKYQLAFILYRQMVETAALMVQPQEA